MSAHAWFAATGQNITNHAATMSELAARVERGYFVSPWSGSCRGCHELGEQTFRGLHGLGPMDRHVELLANPELEDFPSRFALLLQSTRDYHFDGRKAQLRKQLNRRRLSREIKRRADARLNPTTVFDYLLRLRERLTYKDVSAFMLPEVDDWWYEQFHRGLLSLTDWTNLQLHSLVVATVGLEVYAEIAAEFQRRAGEPLRDIHSFVGDRLDLLRTAE